MKKELKNLYGHKLKKLLKDYKLTQSELARKTGISLSTINDYVCGKTILSEKNRVLIAKALNIPKEDLLIEPVIFYTDTKQFSQNDVYENYTATLNKIIIFSPYKYLKVEKEKHLETLYEQTNYLLFLEEQINYTNKDYVCFYDEYGYYHIELYKTGFNHQQILGKIISILTIFE